MLNYPLNLFSRYYFPNYNFCYEVAIYIFSTSNYKSIIYIKVLKKNHYFHHMLNLFHYHSYYYFFYYF